MSRVLRYVTHSTTTNFETNSIKIIKTHPVPPPKGRIFTFSSPSGATISSRSWSLPLTIIVSQSAKSIESRNRGSIYESRGATSDVFIWIRVQATRSDSSWRSLFLSLFHDISSSLSRFAQLTSRQSGMIGSIHAFALTTLSKRPF